MAKRYGTATVRDERKVRLHTERPKRNKYGVSKKEDRTLDGIVFASKREMKRYKTLKALLDAGAIRDLELQPTFDLLVNGVKIGRYSADFRYTVVESGEQRTEDVKGMRTREFRRTKKHIRAQYGVEILEV